MSEQQKELIAPASVMIKVSWYDSSVQKTTEVSYLREGLLKDQLRQAKDEYNSLRDWLYDNHYDLLGNFSDYIEAEAINKNALEQDEQER